MYNKTVIVGNVGRDAEMRYTQDGVAVTSFSVAANRKWNNADGSKGEKATWFKVTAWRKLAETCNQYVKKGMLVLVEGEIDASAYLPKDGGDPRASLELTAREVKFLKWNDDNAGDNQSSGPSADYVPQEAIPF